MLNAYCQIGFWKSMKNVRIIVFKHLFNGSYKLIC